MKKRYLERVSSITEWFSSFFTHHQQFSELTSKLGKHNKNNK
ncbi:hypothetical protein HMPREF2141_02823 [Bacteroides uniformis]|jgi:hypothetical protein|uniref:Uncharacterized protein n=2 Tax=Bacteroides uniformis TaxID=820 RepID=A0A078RYM4_BACUN|nr:hypothetical protein BACUNI_04052 [Bacteroides uniformis ATCC 8492]KDS47916.1 hypothetical protein M094_2847 [Bacteroides uniformis str. 3978 T3 ii]KDS61912.1 hypothetical protein M093_0244 [Bacteroides uniformis str. 3978 T3 i]KXT33507.1 hypothetical protein HMPREF2141_02823 [Bacteroides uniformis]DAZ03903.1 MAG TPA: hypothetical protein [Caudoviricetes sp.]